jgi:YfiH family protein
LQRRNTDGLVTYHFESLAVEGLVHAVFTRLGGVSRAPFATLNVGNTVGDAEASVAENHARIYTHLDLDAGRVASPRQVHSNRVAVVTAEDAGQVIANTDGLVTNVPGIALLLRFADCQPILLYDPANHALGLIHAGWRGVAQAIARRAVETMQEAYGTRPQELIAGLGPAIGPSCYAVGHNVASAMGYALPDWSQVMTLEGDTWYFDLPAANAQQLVAAGIRTVEQAHLCTACRTDEFFSHRAEKGRTGRFAVVAYLQARAGEQARAAAETQQAEPEPEGSTLSDSLHPPGLPAFQELLGDNQ